MTASTSARIAQGPLGANRLPSGEWEFLLWAPHVRRASIHLLGSAERIVDMDRVEMDQDDRGYYSAVIEATEQTRYMYRLDGSREFPDPASRFQPEGVHGPSQMVDPSTFKWTDSGWTGVPLERSIFYELHVGTYTLEGTFEALISHLDDLASLGITTIELMPIAQFPGARNWGYDGVFPFAAQNTYGGPKELQRLVNAAHARGLAVALDVVYNHLGPEGNYLAAYGPYFTDRYRTPWGEAINYDGPGSDEVRRYFIENALYWLEHYHFDALRLDGVHGIFDFSALHFLAELKLSVAELSRRLGRQIHLIAESDLNDSRIILPQQHGGYEMDAQWSDDFHHSLHTLLTHEKVGYYQDFGRVSHLAQTLRDGWCYSGQYSHYRQRKHGNSPRGISSSHFVVCNQNHDQVGNRAAGERLSALVNVEALKLAAGVTLLSPFVPMLFMGEEYGETASFQYFTSHLDADLVEAVRRGRRDEFKEFGWEGFVPDPQDEATFRRSQLQHSVKVQEPHATLLRFYKELIRIRKEQNLGKPGEWRVRETGNSSLLVFRDDTKGRLAMIFNFNSAPSLVTSEVSELRGLWRTKLSSADRAWHGPGESFPAEVRFSKPFVLHMHPHSFVLFEGTSHDSEPA